MPDPNSISYFARTNHRNEGRLVGIKQADRLHHMFVIGKTGTGKSSLLEVFMRQDLESGRGFALLDPHGDLAERVHGAAQRLAPSRTLYLDAADVTQPYGYNPLRHVRYDSIPVAVSGFLETLKKLWPDAWGVRMEHVLRNSLYALYEQPEASLPDLLRLYSDDGFRKTVTSRLRNLVVRQFWLTEFESYPDRLRAEAVAPIQNKLGALLTDPRLYRLFVSHETDIRFRPLMDGDGALIANLAKGRLGEESSNVAGGVLLSTMFLAALSRATEAPAARRPFFIYVDEFQTFATLTFLNMLSELRKYGVGVTIATQQMNLALGEIATSALSNTSSLVSFRLGADDASRIARELGISHLLDYLLSLPTGSMYTSILIDGMPSMPFSANARQLQ